MDKRITKYKEIESFLYNQLPMFQRVGPKAFKKDLNNIIHLSDHLGDPHKSYKTIHIAGTNGKGSTSFFLASALSELGYNVGLYTSPHYKDYRERIKVNGKMISKSFVKKFVNGLIEEDLLTGALKPSFFEITVAMAFEYFKDQKVDYAVIETGLGGRLDSTNIITPELSVITNIGLDHTNFLGDTLELISAEKAGIIKSKIPVVIGRRQSKTDPVFKKVAKSLRSKIIYAEDYKPLKISKKLKGQFPDYQHENMQTAYTSLCSIFNKVEANKIEKAWESGLKKWGYVGRYMYINRKPLTIYDSAHNLDGINVLLDQLSKEKFDKIHFILAMVGDKNQDKILALLPKDANYYFSQAKIPRAMAKEELQSQAQSHDLQGKTYISIRKALAAASKKANDRDLILVAGSIFTVAEVL